MNSKSGKVWGHTSKIFDKNNVTISRIHAKKGGFSSTHCHKKRFNAFFIEKGKLLIKVWKNDYDLVDETIVSDGEMCSVPPEEYHAFEALEDTIAYEIYWVQIDDDDIVRKDHGGAKQK